MIPESSELVQILKDAQLKHPKLRWRVDKKLTQEELLLQVAEGKIAYTLANSLDISATQQIKPQIAVAFDLTDEMSVHWYLSNNSSNELQ